jgi:hypothetical protein
MVECRTCNACELMSATSKQILEQAFNKKQRQLGVSFESFSKKNATVLNEVILPVIDHILNPVQLIGQYITYKDHQEKNKEKLGLVLDKVSSGYNQQASSTVYVVQNLETDELQTVLPINLNKLIGTKIDLQVYINRQNPSGQERVDGVSQPKQIDLTVDNDDLPF